MPLDKLLRSEWTAAGYTEMGSEAVVRPPATHLVRAYHLTSAAHAVSGIALRRLKVARVHDLNDPYELMGEIWRHIEKRPMLQKRKDEYDRHNGLLCFSRNWTNSVLWSHYGDKHRGICLGFDLRRSEVKPVTYRDERLPDTVSSSSAEDLAFDEELLLAKFRHWEYEKELRLIVPLQDEGLVQEGAFHFKPFGNDLALAEVILGDQCEVSLAVVRSLVTATHPTAITFKARLAGKKYAVVADGESVP